MKCFYKNEIACAMGVTGKTFARWLKPHEKNLLKLGYTRNSKLLPPAVVLYLCDVFCIDKSELPRY